MRRSTNSTRTYKRLRIARAGMDGDNHRALLKMLDPKARDDLRHVLIHDQADRDAVSSQLSATATDMATTGPTSSTC